MALTERSGDERVRLLQPSIIIVINIIIVNIIIAIIIIIIIQFYVHHLLSETIDTGKNMGILVLKKKLISLKEFLP